MKRFWAVWALTVVTCIGGCRGAGQAAGGPHNSNGVSAVDPIQVEYEPYREPRYGFTVQHPVGWLSGGSFQGDILAIAPPKADFMDVTYPSIRVFTEDRDEEKGLNLAPAKKESMIGNGNWPYMTVENAEDTRVETAKGPAAGYLLRGGGEAKGVKYRALGLYVYGTGHSIDVICSSPADSWDRWQAMCQEVIKTFKAGDMSVPHPMPR